MESNLKSNVMFFLRAANRASFRPPVFGIAREMIALKVRLEGSLTPATLDQWGVPERVPEDAEETLAVGWHPEVVNHIWGAREFEEVESYRSEGKWLTGAFSNERHVAHARLEDSGYRLHATRLAGEKFIVDTFRLIWACE
jgi:hypothetical protein